MEVTNVLISKLNPAKYNPRQISNEQLEALKASINRWDMVEPIVVNKNNMVIVGGHQRVKALKSLGRVDVPVHFVDLNEADEKALNIALNRISGEFDQEKLADIVAELQGLNFDGLFATGLDDADFEELAGFNDSITKLVTFGPGDDDIPPAPVDPITKPGDVYEIGSHRLMCGDSTSLESVQKLMDGAKADMVFTDPPYGVDYSSKNEFLNNLDKGNRVQTPIENDAIADYREWFGSWLKTLSSFLNHYNTCYFCMSGQELHNLRLAMDDAGYKWGDYLIWVKNNHVLGRKDYNSKHEFIVYGWHGVHKFYGDFSTTVIEVDKPLKNDLHPTMKPIELITKFISDGSPDDGSIIDLFGGSGSTMVAAEKTGRSAYLMELSQHYCDVIVTRMRSLFPDLPVTKNGVAI